MYPKVKMMMDDQIRTWLRLIPEPRLREWLESLYVDNILKVSRGGENVPAAFAEYGKKLMADRILEEHAFARQDPVKGFNVTHGAEILTGEIVPATRKTEEE